MWFPARHTITFLLIGIFFAFFAVLLSIPAGFFVTGVLFTMVLWNGLTNVSSLGTVRCERFFQDEYMEGESAKMKLCLTVSREITDILIEDHFSPALEDSSVSLYAHTLSPNAPMEFSYIKKCQKRGVYELGPLVLKTGDPYGFFLQKRRISLKGRMVVYPRLFELLNFPTLPVGTTAQMGVASGKRQGDAGDYFGNREYQWGDSLRMVHWRNTARFNQLIVKQFEKVASSEVILFLDLLYENEIGKGNETTLEASLRLAGSIAKYLLLNGILVQVIAHGEEPVLLDRKSVV